MVTVNSKGDDGTQYEVTLSQTVGDKGSVQVKRWAPGKAAKGKLLKNDTTKLYNIRASADGAMVVAKADVPFNDPDVIFNIQPELITVSIVGAVIGNGVTLYPVAVADAQSIRTFLIACGFPNLQG